MGRYACTEYACPTPVAQHQNYPVGVYEGGGYSAKGIYRPAFNCRMKTNEYPEFCRYASVLSSGLLSSMSLN